MHTNTETREHETPFGDGANPARPVEGQAPEPMVGTLVPASVRSPSGRFAPGNAGGPGNPHAAQCARLRAELLRAVTPKTIRTIARALTERAKRGDLAAIKMLLDFTVGKPVAQSDGDPTEVPMPVRVIVLADAVGR